MPLKPRSWSPAEGCLLTGQFLPASGSSERRARQSILSETCPEAQRPRPGNKLLQFQAPASQTGPLQGLLVRLTFVLNFCPAFLNSLDRILVSFCL